MIAAYQNAHAMVFLSTKESFGFPLLEAMYLGLPIVCADLPYAHALCAQGAIYFDPASVQSLKNAIAELQLRLQQGWVPDWTAQLQKFPQDWDRVASIMAKIVGTAK
jgi:glycosyltransferase involved in cell wall biosynthesis